MSQEYEVLLDLVRRRRSVRRFKPDPLPEGALEKVLEAGRWGVSGANGQPWEFIVVTDPVVKRELFRLYREENDDFIFWMEQMRLPELRHPGFQLEGEADEQWRRLQARPGWDVAPALIVVLGDGRKQWTTVMGAHTFGRHQSHLTDGLATACMLMHCAAAALGLGTQWVTIHLEEPFKRALGVPHVLNLYQIIPVGYPEGQVKKSGRRRLAELVHHDRYDPEKHLSNREIVEHVRSTRVTTRSKYLKAEETPE